MSKKIIYVFIFWWAIIFPELAINDFTTDILSNDCSTTFPYISNVSHTQKSTSNVSYEFWLNKFLFSKQ